MEILIRGEKVQVTDSMKDYVTEKLDKLSKYVDSAYDIKANVLVKVRNHNQKIEITIPLKSFIIRAEETQADFYAAVDVAVDKLERQIRKNKTRIASKMSKTKLPEINYQELDDIDLDEKEKVVKRKVIEVKPMDEEEAILQMELLGHQFYLYKDINSNKPTVIYKRKDGGYGIIEAE